MILSLWITFVSLSLIMIVIGFARPEHSEQALIGFFFLFLLSFSIINNDVQYVIGENTSTYYVYGRNFTGYHWDYSDPLELPTNPADDTAYLFHENTETNILYADFGNHDLGYWLAIASAIGMAGILWNLKKNHKEKE